MMIVRSREIMALAMAAGCWAANAWADDLASPWSEGKIETKARLVAGSVAGAPVAAVEIVLGEGWKTYWRFPGEAGGVPPVFDWAKSDNVARVTVLYPAPKRLIDKAGETLGYKGAVVFPVVIEPKDAGKPVGLRLTLEYGVCRDVCVPVDTELSLDIPAGLARPLPANVIAALEHVPRSGEAHRGNDPTLVKSEVRLDGANPLITFEAEFPGGAAKADAFIEGPNGVYVPSPKAGSGKDLGANRLRFEIDLTGAVDPADIKGKTAIVTLVSELGESETIITLE